MKRFSIAIALSCAAATAYSQDSLFHIAGYAEYDHITYIENVDAQINARNQSAFGLECKSAPGQAHSFYTLSEVRADLSDPSRNRLMLKEAYFDMKYKLIDLRAGRQIIAWGKTDGINPTNVINPTDNSDILDTDNETLGIDALNSKLYLSNWVLQTVFIPVFTPSVLPDAATNRWYADLPQRIHSQPGLGKAAVVPGENHKPEADIRSAQYAASLSGNIKNIDIDCYYYNGMSHVPEIELAVSPISADSLRVAINQRYYRHQMAGMALATTWGSWGFRAEGAYFMPRQIINDKPYFQYVAGIDHTFANVYGSNNIFVIAQWIHEVADKDAVFSNQNLNHLFQKDVMLRTECGLGSNTKLNLQGLYNLDFDDYYLQAELEHNLANGFNVSAAADILGGPRDSFFYSYRNNDRVQIRMKYNF